jgi:peptidoglycan/LPS O-acetylase OafA/YrhL
MRLRGIRLGDRLGSRDNNFDLLRLAAAVSVLVSHSFALTGHEEPLHEFGTTLGSVGVLVFFAVSGLLIHRSWDRDPSARDFWAKRALRLLPALATVSVLTALVIGPLATALPLGSYFTQPETWLYPVRVTLLYPFGAGLPGVFETSLYAGAVNGPLWSLPVEVFAYLVLFVLGVLGLLRDRRLVLAVAALSLVWAAVWVPNTSGVIGATYVLSAFALGAAAYSFADRIVLAWPAALVVTLLCVPAGLAPDPVRVVVWTPAAVYLSCWFAYALPHVGRVVSRTGDASYGVYVWAFPVQQLIVQEVEGVGPWGVVAVATPVVLALGLTSWHLVERPALRHKPDPGRGTPTPTPIP